MRQRVDEACRRAGRDPDGVALLAASKYSDAPGILELAAAGQRLFGENRVQEARAKVEELPYQVRRAIDLHMIGHLQSNKARAAAALFDLVQTVDSLHLAEELGRGAATAHRRLPVLVQVNISSDPAKAGFQVDALLADQGRLLAIDSLEVCGLMTIGPVVKSPAEARPTFAALRRLRERLAGDWPPGALAELSMGMSADLEVAIEEGATIVRVGTALFGGHH